MTEERKRPDLSITLKNDEGEDHVIKLVYGLWADLQRLAPTPEVVLDSMLSDAYTRDFIIRRCFTASKVAVTEEKNLVAEIPVNDPDELDKLTNWVSEHLLYFFVKSARSLKTLGQAFGVEMKSLAQQPPSPSGSQDSASSKPTAGDSDAASQTSGMTSTGDTASGS